MRRGRFVAWCATPETLRALHGWATLFWIGLAVPSVLWWRSSISYLVLLSVYAVITGHWSAWQSARTEVRQVEDAG